MKVVKNGPVPVEESVILTAKVNVPPALPYPPITPPKLRLIPADFL